MKAWIYIPWSLFSQVNSSIFEFCSTDTDGVSVIGMLVVRIGLWVVDIIFFKSISLQDVSFNGTTKLDSLFGISFI